RGVEILGHQSASRPRPHCAHGIGLPSPGVVVECTPCNHPRNSVPEAGSPCSAVAPTGAVRPRVRNEVLCQHHARSPARSDALGSIQTCSYFALLPLHRLMEHTEDPSSIGYAKKLRTGSPRRVHRLAIPIGLLIPECDRAVAVASLV